MLRNTFGISTHDLNSRSGYLQRCCVVCCLGVLLLTTSGCHSLQQWWHNGFKVGPNHCTPAATVAEVWMEADDPRVSLDSSDFADWWSVFNDPVLDGLILNAYQQNLTLREAGFRVLQAQAERAIARGERLPQVQQINGDYTRLQTSSNILQIITSKKAFDQWMLDFNVGWELDIWGHYRRLVEAADAELDASVNSYDAILNTLISEVALTYVEIRSLQEQLEYARENITIQKNSLEIAEAQLREGATDQVSVEFAKANLEATTALQPGLEIELRTAANRLCVLLGVPPRQLGPILGVQPVPVVPNDVAVGIPADLIRRRPDIRADEQIVAAQCALVGIAESELYPSFFINGTLRLSSQRLDRLFTSESLGGVIGPAFQWNVLNYGRLISNVKVFDAELEQAVSRYQETVLEAAAEVENGLTAFLRSQEEYAAIESSNQANLRALELVTFQFREGEIDFTPLYVLQANIVTQQIDLVRAKAEISLNLIKLYKALGGGWQLRCHVDPKCGLITQGFEGIAIPPNGSTPRLDEPFAPEGNAPLEPSVLESLQGMSEEEVRIMAAELLKQLANTQTDKTQAVEPRTNRTRDPATAPKNSLASSPTRKSVDRIGSPTDENSQETPRSVNARDSNPVRAQQTAFSAGPENPSKTNSPRTASQVNEALKQILGRFQSDPGTEVVR